MTLEETMKKYPGNRHEINKWKKIYQRQIDEYSPNVKKTSVVCMKRKNKVPTVNQFVVLEKFIDMCRPKMQFGTQ